MTLYKPPDILEAHNAWGANCGPCTLAAIIQRPVMQVRDLFPDFSNRRYVNPTHMKEALRLAGVRFSNRFGADKRPRYGLAFIQWRGPWDERSVAEQYRHTHWIGVAAGVHTPTGKNLEVVYDVNAGHWVSRADWEDVDKGVAAWIVKHTKGATGAWFIRTGIEVRPEGVQL